MPSRCTKSAISKARSPPPSAVAIEPDNATAHFNLAQLLLLDGQFERGWREQEWRWDCRGFPSPKRNFPQPLWDGSRSAATVLLHAEQGAGDALMAARYIPLVAERAKVIVECPRDLADLIRTVGGADQIVHQKDPLPAFDAHAPLLSLPMIFQTRVETIPGNVPYLKADPARVAAWQNRLAGQTRPKIGIAWAGTPTHLNDANRSMPFVHLAPLAQLHSVAFYSLQKGPRSEDARDAAMPAGWLTDWTSDLHDYADTAALIECLDLVVTVDTSVAHVAARWPKKSGSCCPSPPTGAGSPPFRRRLRGIPRCASSANPGHGPGAT